VPDDTVQSEAFYSGAMIRITRIMPMVGAIFTGFIFFRFGWQIAAGFAVGCLIAYVNFHWLKRVVTALADRTTATGRPQSSSGVVGRFLLRYALIALGCYVIFRVSRVSLFGLLAGLFLPVAAILCEAVYEVYVALRRGL
jgi:ATP synthase I chain